MGARKGLATIRVLKAEHVVFPYLHRIVTCEERLEDAMHFLVMALADRPRRGKKPVLMHSLRVGYFLLAGGHATDVVIAGFLHDIIEKTSVTQAQLRSRFGPEIGRMVAATTNDTKILDPLVRYEDSLKRCAKAGPGALIVRVADLVDNCDRVMAMGARARMDRLRAKLKLLIDVCRREKVNVRLIDELSKRLRRITKVHSIALVTKKATTNVRAKARVVAASRR